MTARIAAHRAGRDCGGRGAFWRTVEAPLALADTIAAEAHPARPLLIDCLTLWLSNLMLAERPIGEEFAALRAALRDAAGPIVLVANEVGLGLVPETRSAAISRRRRPCPGNRRSRRPRRLCRRGPAVAEGI
jgi:adenosylcobinamide kinase/adenosylcobinamide-phosphate guanylyltransferase